ncbi:aminotransferase class I/II-fold pyridoxal phosphate-dependent enzyme [Streptomyces fradiae]|uniref:aminotransferase class I/II-fold pyridoxal phosphate-dependent enzyme n=1 Tax=Streptomyces fradiae TaxID=1906 RepID=UPI0033DB8275
MTDELARLVAARGIRAGSDAVLYHRAMDAIDGVTAAYDDGAPPQLLMTTYDYLGVLGHPAVNERAKAAIDELGTGGHCTGTAAGSLRVHRRLEERLAALTGHDASLLFPSGYQANHSVLPALAGEGDWVFSDRLNHASLVDGCLAARARGARVRVFEHNDAEHLGRLLGAAPPAALRLVVCDAVFSADGDVLDLPAFDAVCREYGAVLYLDEAHSLGVFGAGGAGLYEHFRMEDRSRTLTMGALSKTLASVGGFVAADRGLVDALRLTARGHVFSGVLPASAAAAALAALDVLDAEGTARRAAFWRNVRQLTMRMREAGLPFPDSCGSGIVPLVVGREERALAVAEHCRRNGVMAVPFLWPVCARGQARLRLNVTARHTLEQVDAGVAALAAAYHATRGQA